MLVIVIAFFFDMIFKSKEKSVIQISHQLPFTRNKDESITDIISDQQINLYCFNIISYYMIEHGETVSGLYSAASFPCEKQINGLCE